MVTDTDYRAQLRDLSHGGEGMITQYEALRHGYAYVDLSRITLEEDTIGLLQSSTARSLQVLPVRKDGMNIWVCMQMPPEPKSMEKLAVETGCRVIPVSVISEALELSVAYYYPG